MRDLSVAVVIAALLSVSGIAYAGNSTDSSNITLVDQIGNN